MHVAMFSNTYLPTTSGVLTSMTLFRKGLTQVGHEPHVFDPEYEDYRDQEPNIFRLPAIDLSEEINLSIVVSIKNLMEPAVHGITPALIHSHHSV